MKRFWKFLTQNWWCFWGLHRWDSPGGHCEDCGTCDEFFGSHTHPGEGFK